MAAGLINRNQCLLVGIDMQARLAPAIHDGSEVITRNQWLFAIAQELEVPCMMTEQYPQGLGPTVGSLQTALAKSTRIEKTHFSVWQESDVRPLFKTLGKKQVILTGTESHVCVLQSAVDLRAADYEVFVVSDAVGSRSRTDKDTALQRMAQLGIYIVTAEMVVFEWLHRSATDEFRTISQNYLRNPSVK